MATPPATAAGAPSAAAPPARRSVLIVDGMFCAACAASVEAALARHPGVASAAVNFAADAAVVQWRDGVAAAPASLEALVRRLGYRPRVIGAEGTEAASERALDGPSAAAASRDDPARDLTLRLVIALFFGMWTMLPSIALYLDAADTPAMRLALAWGAGVLSLPVVAFSGLPFYRMGVATLRSGVAGIDALVTLGVLGSLLLSALALARGSADVYFEVPVALVTLQLVARLIDLRVRQRARDAVGRLLALTPTQVSLVAPDRTARRVAANEVEVGDRVLLEAGEHVPVDGRVVAGAGDVDRSLLSGESAPASAGVGDSVFAGERLLDGALEVAVTAAPGRRRIDALARQVRDFLAARPAWQRLADRIARHFLLLSGLLAALAFALARSGGADAAAAAVRALAVFVIACPCALSLAIPVAALGASRAAARAGMILRDLNVLTGAARPTRLFLDKTGTLTLGRPAVRAVHTLAAASDTDVLRAAACAERASAHPLARGIVAAAVEAGAVDGADAAPAPARLRSVAGGGVELRGEGGGPLRVGSQRWLATLGVTVPADALPASDATRVLVARGRQVLGAIDLDDALRPGAAALVAALRDAGLEPCLLSGDGEAPVRRVAADLGIPAHAALSPEAKVEIIRAARAAGDVVAFAGDGINDSTALAAADFGIAVGGATDAARAAAAVTLDDGDVTRLPSLFELTARTRRIVRQNLAFAVLYNTIAIPAALAGVVHPAIAALAMAASSVTVLLNGARAARPATSTA